MSRHFRLYIGASMRVVMCYAMLYYAAYPMVSPDVEYYNVFCYHRLFLIGWSLSIDLICSVSCVMSDKM